MERCAQCASQSNLRRCTGCLEVWYCSKECQKEHWSQHKTTCRKPSSSTTETKKDKTKKRAVGNLSGETTQAEGNLERKKSQDKVIDEVDETAQANDNGTPAEDATGGVGDKGNADGKEMMCQNCGNFARDLKKCGRCKEVAYCSRDCQRVDWPTHMVTCTSAGGFRELQKQEREAERRVSQEAPHNLLRNLHMTSPLTWAEARSRAARAFPEQPIEERFECLPMGRPFFTVGPVLLCRITRPYPHPVHHARYVEDVTGDEMYVIFFNGQPPEPYFQYNQLREGNFLCFIDAYTHRFHDFSVGLRINNPADVRIIEQ